MTIKGNIQSLQPGVVIELFVLDLTRYGAPIVHFRTGTNQLSKDVIWQSVTYQRYPVQAFGFRVEVLGPLPRPHFVVTNVGGIVSAICCQFSDLVGCSVIRKRTLLRYLDAANFPHSNPLANPAESFPDDVLYVNQKPRESIDTVEFELAVAFDVEGVQLPRRQVITNACAWKYRGDGCDYAWAPVADANDNPCQRRTVGKRLKSCKLRFGNGWMPYGEFPGAGRVRRGASHS